MLSDHILFWVRHRRVPRLKPWQILSDAGTVVEVQLMAMLAELNMRMAANEARLGVALADAIRGLKAFGEAAKTCRIEVK